MTKILITGVAGMIGSHVLDRSVEAGYTITGIDNLSIGKLENIAHHLDKKAFTFVEGDVLDRSLLNDIGADADIILHLAATKKISESDCAARTLDGNTKSTENCLELARTTGARVVFASTSDVYGMAVKFPIHEDHNLILGPPHIKRWSYAVSKLYGEQLCFAYHKDYGIPVVVIRYFGAFSERSSFTWSGGHVPVFIDMVLKDEPLTIHGDGSQTRSMAAVDDVVDGTMRCLESDKAVGEVINIGNDEEMTILESARVIHRLAATGNDLKIEFIPFRKIFGDYTEIKRRVPDLSKAERLLDYRPTQDFEPYVKKIIDIHRNRLFA